SSPFSTPVRTNEKAHWVRPEVVVEVKFNEWTADNRLRQPIFLGVRDDKNARDVTREASSVQRGTKRRAATRRREGAAASVKQPVKTKRASRGEDIALPRGVDVKLSNLEKVWFPGRA